MQTSIAKKIFAVGAASAMIAAALPFVASAQQHAVGTNVVSNGTVYFINSSNQKQPYTSAGAFLSYGFNSWASVQAASPEDLALPTGSFVPPADGSLINDNGTVYIMTNGSRAGFTTAAVFTGLGYSFSNVIPGDTSFMNTLTPVSSTAMAHLPGTLVNQAGTVYLISSTGKQGIPSLAVFNSWGYSWNSVVPSNTYDNALPMSNGIMPTWQMGMLSPLGTVISPTPTPTGTVLPVSGGLSVSLASSTPASAYIAAGSAFNNMANVNFTAGSSSVIVTQLTVTRTGLGSDSDINNIYLFNGSSRIGYSSSLGSGRATFSNSNGLFTVPANSTVVISLKMDLSSSVSTSKTYSLGIASASDVVTSGNGSVVGTFPVVGNAMTSTVLSNPALATLQVSASTVGTSVNAGSTGVLVGQFQFLAQNSAVKLSYLTLTEVGSINASTDLANIMLKNGSGTQVGTTIPQLSSSNQANFDLTANPYTISSGQNVTFSVYADVLGTPGRNFYMSIQRNSDVQAMDQTYNAGILATVSSSATCTSFPVQQDITACTAAPISVQAGNLVVNTDANSPTGNIATGVSNQTLSQFDFTASGEPVKINNLPVTFLYANGTVCNTTTAADCNNSVLANLKLVDDQGVQIGSTYTTPSSILNYAVTTCTTNPTLTGTCDATHEATSVNGFTGTFGNSSSQLNYTILANTTRVISIKSDILSTATTAGAGIITGVQANLASGGSAQGQVSLATVTTTANSGRALTFSATPFYAALNSSLAPQTVVPGATNQRVASFTLSAAAGEAINLSSVTIEASAATNTFQNMKVFVNGTQFGTYTQGSITPSASYAFSGNAVVIPAGGSVSVDVYEDTLSGAAAASPVPAYLQSAQGSGASSGTSRSATQASGAALSALNGGAGIAGQLLTLSTTSSSLVVTTDSGAVAASTVAMGATGVTMGSFKLTTGTAEGANITSLKLVDTFSGTTANAINALQNIKLFDGQTQIGGTVTGLTLSGGTGVATFTFSPAYHVPVSTVKTITIVSDVAAFNSTTSTSGSIHTFSVAGSNIVATGDGSGLSITATGTGTSNGQTVYRTNLTVNLDPSSPTGTRVVSSTDQPAIFDFKAASNYDAVLNTVTLAINGPSFENFVTLRDANGVIAVTCTGGTTATAVAPYGTNCETSSTGTITLTLPTGYTISAGTTRAISVELNSTTSGTATSWAHTGTAYNNYQVTISAVGWNDNSGTTSTTANAALPANVLPIVGNTLQY